MKQYLRNALLVIMVLTVTIVMIMEKNSEKALADSNKNITVESYIEKLVKAANLTVDSTVEDSYVTAAIAGGLISQGEYVDYNVDITRADAAVLAERADEILYGAEYQQALYYQIIDKKRISDLGKIEKEKQDEVVKVFEKGIMVGYSNGKYTQNRSFKGNDKLLKSEVNKIMERITKPSGRKKISPDGQVTRTTKLPKNYKSYSYILESFPNSFYEEKFYYQLRGWGWNPVYLEDYSSPKDLKKCSPDIETYREHWCALVEKNLQCRLNFNYKTVNDEWISKLRSTYPIYWDKSMNEDYMDAIKQYVRIAKKNKVIIKSSKVTVEPSSMYYISGEGFMVRCYVRFKIESAASFYTYESRNQRLMIYGSNINLKGLKKNKWYTATFDMGLTGNSMNDDGSGHAVTTDWMYK
jgi:hypothetical protein